MDRVREVSVRLRKRWLSIGVFAVIAVIVIAALLVAGFRNIPAGHKGVILSSPSGPNRDEINEGWSWNPGYIVSQIEIVRWNTQTRDMVGFEGSSLTVRSSDNLNIQVDLSLVFHMQPDKVADIYIDNGNIYEIIDRYLRNVPRDVASNFTGEYIGGIGRVIIQEEVLRRITTALGIYQVIVEDILLRSVDLPDTVDKAIEEKLAAQQAVVTAELQRQATVVRALGEGQALIIAAQAEANATVLRANGTAAAIALIITQLKISDPNLTNATWAYLTMLYIEAIKTNPNTVFVIVGANGNPIIINPNP
jgi:regulator of protease activity HflC (stomatin/prohibitin superfamily)